MITVKQACKIAMDNRPQEYVYIVNEFADVFLMRTVPNGWRPEECTWGLTADIVDKRTGRFEYSNLCDERLQAVHRRRYC